MLGSFIRIFVLSCKVMSFVVVKVSSFWSRVGNMMGIKVKKVFQVRTYSFFLVV